jgi:hypothetical protein
VPFARLPADVAEYDRIFVREIPTLLVSAGLQVARPRPHVTACVRDRIQRATRRQPWFQYRARRALPSRSRFAKTCGANSAPGVS